jgi:MFS family permease
MSGGDANLGGRASFGNPNPGAPLRRRRPWNPRVQSLDELAPPSAREDKGLSSDPHAAQTTAPSPKRWGAFSNRPFAVIWVATTLSLTGIAMSDTASAWLMTNLNTDPMAVSMVQVASSLPMFLFTLPAGALADIVEARRFLIAMEAFITALIVVFAAMVFMKWETPTLLLGTTFLLSASWSLAAPAWLAITPLLVPRSDLDAATAVNNVGYNISRAVGPAVAGLLIGALGVAAPYWLFAAANLGTITALLWWRAPRVTTDSLPAERLTSAVRTGLRHAAYNSDFRATLIRTVAVYPFAAAYIALLPLVARSQMTQGPQLYGILLGAISVGAVAGSFALRPMKSALGPDRAVVAGTLGISIALVLLGLSREPWMALAAALLAGASWTIVLASLYVSAQIALPDWVRGRGLAIFLTVIFGSVTLGSAVWGRLAGKEGVPIALFAAAAGAIVAVPLTWRWKLQTAEGTDLSPSMHWRAPMLAKQLADENGPVLVTVKYRIAGEDSASFLAAMEDIGRQRRRDGAYAWGVFEDVAEKGQFLETFLIESWLETKHLRERVTNADRLREEYVHGLIREAPSVTLMIASDLRRQHSNRRALASSPA